MAQHLIIVDTPERHLGQVTQALQEHGYRPRVVEAQDALLAALDEAECQLVFFNLQVPEVRELCEAMRNHISGTIVPVIFLGVGDPKTQPIRSPAEALSAGGDYYFAAPFDLPRILAKVRTYVGLSQQDDAAVIELGDLDQPARHRRPPAPEAEPLGGASDAVLAQICSREAEMADMLRDGPAPISRQPPPAAALPQAPEDAPAAAPPPRPVTMPRPQHAPEPAERAVAIAYRPLAPASGTLRPEYDLARLLCDALRQRVTGRLTLENGHAQSMVYFIEGVPTKVQDLRAPHRLEEYLRRTQKIGAPHYQQVRSRGLRRSAEVKAYLLEKNVLGADVLEEALHTQLKEQLIELFAYSTASFSYSPQLCDVGLRLHLRLDIRNIVMQAIRKSYVLAQLVGRVGDADVHVAVCPEQQGQLDALTLTGAELALLSLLDGRRSLHEVATLSGLKMERVYQAVYGMLCVGAAQVVQAASTATDDAAAAAEHAATSRIAEKLQQVRMQDYYQILSLAQDASMQDVEAAYLSTSQQFAPAAFAAGVQSEQRQNLEEIKTVIDEAYEVLRDPQLRPLYSRHVA